MIKRIRKKIEKYFNGSVLELKNKSGIFILFFTSVLFLLGLFNKAWIFDQGLYPHTSLSEKTVHPHFQFPFKDVTPSWSPQSFCGMPLDGSILNSKSVNIIDWSFSKLLSLVNAPDFFFYLFNYLLFVFFLYLFIKRRGLPPYIALFSSLALVFIPQFTGFLAGGHDSAFLCVCLIPLILFLADKLIEQNTALYFSLTALAFGFQLIRFNPLASYITFLILLSFFIFQYVSTLPQKRKRIRMSFSGILLLGAIVAGFLLASYLYVPVMDIQRFTTANLFSFGNTAERIVSTGAFHPLEMLTFIIPSFLGFGGQSYWGPEASIGFPLYFGIIILLFAGMALIIKRNNLVWYLAIVSVISLLLSFGNNLSLTFVPFKTIIPFLGSINNLRFFHIMFDISIVIMAGIGLYSLSSFDKIRFEKGQKKIKRSQLIRYLFIFSGITGFIALVILSNKSHFMEMIASSKVLFNIEQREAVYQLVKIDCIKTISFVFAASTLIYLFINKKIAANALILFSTLLVLVDLWLVDIHILKPGTKTPSEDPREQSASINLVKEKEGLFRIFSVDAGNGKNVMYDSLHNITGQSSNRLHIYQDFLDESGFDYDNADGLNPFTAKYWRLVLTQNKQFWQPYPVPQIKPERLNFDYAMLDMLNVKYLILNKFLINDMRYSILSKKKPWIYENKSVLPRVFFADSVEVLSGKERIFDRLKDGHFDPRKTAIIENLPLFPISSNTDNKATIISYKNDQIDIKAHILTPTIMILSEIYYPSGWKAFVDNHETAIYKTNYILRSIFLQPGKHDITFRYSPLYFIIGRWISFITLILLTTLLLTVGYIHIKDKFKRKQLKPVIQEIS